MVLTISCHLRSAAQLRCESRKSSPLDDNTLRSRSTDNHDAVEIAPKPHREFTGLPNKINCDAHLCWNCCLGFRTQTLLACSIHHRSESCSDFKVQLSCSGLDAPASTPSRLLRSTCPRHSDDILTRRARHSAPCGRLHTQTSILRPPNSCRHCQTCPAFGLQTSQDLQTLSA